MALVKCGECGNEISTKAKSCPRCGFTPAPKTKVTTWVIGAVFVAIVGSCVMSVTDSPPPAPPATAAENAVKAQKEAAFQKTVRFATAIKKSMRDPDSIVWETIVANDDASVICLEYRAKNGFGGTNKEFVVYANATPSKKTDDWNRHCANQHLREMKHVKYAVP